MAYLELHVMEVKEILRLWARRNAYHNLEKQLLVSCGGVVPRSWRVGGPILVALDNQT